jgi:predicted DNA-binding transcriptional regulator AlpA
MGQERSNTRNRTGGKVPGGSEASKVERYAIRQERRAVAAKQMASGIHPDALLPIEPHVTTLLNGSKATVYRRARTDPTFPKLIRLTSRCTRIRAGELLDWLKSQGEA